MHSLPIRLMIDRHAERFLLVRFLGFRQLKFPCRVC
jgi:hypothetical protein